MKKIPKYLKNKFILASAIFLVFVLFLDDSDIFTVISQRRKLNRLEALKSETSVKLEETREVLDKLKDRPEVERFAREKKFFKKDDEDIFVIFEEE